MKKIFKVLLILILVFGLSSCSKGKKTINDISDEITILNMEYKIVDYDKYAKEGNEDDVDCKTCEKPYLIVEYDLSGIDKGDDDFVSYTLTFNLNNNGVINIEEADTSKINEDSSNNVTLYFSYGVSEINKKERIEGRVYLFKSIDVDMLIDNEKMETINLEYEGIYDLESVDKDNNLRIVKYKGSKGSVTIPESINGFNITEIGENSFPNYVTNIVFSDNITKVEDGAFDNCSYLHYNEYENGYYLGSTNNPYLVLIKPKTTEITLFQLNLNTKIIYKNAFDGCAYISTMNTPGVTSIGEYAFKDCTRLSYVNISSATSIGDYAFSGCAKLSTIKLADSISYLGCGAFDACESLKYNDYDNGYYLGNSNTNYYILVKYSSTTNESFIVDFDTKIIYSYAFENCSSLKSIKMPNGLTMIGNNAFAGCSSLTDVIIPNSVTSIGICAFAGCSSITSITIPDSVESIGSDAFSYCTSLTIINYTGTQEEWNAIDKEGNDFGSLTLNYNYIGD